MDLMETIITFFQAYGFIWSVHNKITIDKNFPSYIQTSLFLSMFPWFFPIWSHGFSPSASCQETDDPELRPDAGDCDLVHPVAGVDGSHFFHPKNQDLTRETAGKQLDIFVDFGFDILFDSKLRIQLANIRGIMWMSQTNGDILNLLTLTILEKSGSQLKSPNFLVQD